jgi:hypothetical protein
MEDYLAPGEASSFLEKTFTSKKFKEEGQQRVVDAYPYVRFHQKWSNFKATWKLGWVLPSLKMW